MDKALLRLPDVIERVGIKRGSLYRMVERGEFPRPIQLGERTRAWSVAEIDKWISERIAARDKATA